MSASLVIVLTRGLLNVCENLLTETFSEVSKNVITNLQNGLQTRLGNVEYSNTLAISTFLDPRFKCFPFKNNDAVETIKKNVISALTEIINTKSETRDVQEIDLESPINQNSEEKEELKSKYSIWDSLDKNVSKFQPKYTASSRAIIEVQRYLEDEILSRNQNPLDWWRKNRCNYPFLSTLVRTRCCTLATSVPCERLFSKAGIILNERRTRLSTNKIKQLLFINVNNNL